MTRRAYGCLGKSEDPRDYRFSAPRAWDGTYVDLSGGFPESPYDQGALGSCVSNGVVAAVDYARVKQGLAPLARGSRLFVYYQGRVRAGFPITEDTGLEIRDGFTVLAKDGAPREAVWPYDTSRFAIRPPDAAYTEALEDQAVAYGSVRQAGIDAAIAAGYPVVFGFDVYESFESDAVARTGIMPVPASYERALGGHCVVAVSTARSGADIPGAVPTLKYRRCRNSWGTDWADGGYFWMPTVVMDSKHATDFWAVTRMEDPHVPVPPPAVDADAVFVAAVREWLKHPSRYKPLVEAARAWLKARGEQ